jgi:hypothetical protein
LGILVLAAIAPAEAAVTRAIEKETMLRIVTMLSDAMIGVQSTGPSPVKIVIMMTVKQIGV